MYIYMIMRKLFIYSLFLFLATGCQDTSEPGRNPFESGIEVVKKATEDLKSAKDDNEIAAIMQNLVEGMDSIDKSDEWRDYMAKAYKREGRGEFYAHRGFLNSWESVKEKLEKHILDNKIGKITVVGYSHGAAIAALCHEHVWYVRPDLRV